MMDTQDTQADQRRHVQQEQEELTEATRAFMRSLVHTGRNMTLLPVTRLPQDSRQHFLAAGREFTRGWAALIRGFADGIDGLAKESKAPPRSGGDSHGTASGHMLVRPHDKG
jgi:hypothetical protein